MRIACASFDKPVMANMADGGLTPVLPANVLKELGYAFAIYPSATSLAAAAAMETLLGSLKAKGDYAGESLFDFQAFCRLVGFEEVWAFEKKWAPR
jgi:2-methylisocitrate lyase-like PEP mutase family enzyme